MTNEQKGGVYIGLMSGTSLDGISAAVARFTPADAVIPSVARNLHSDAVIPSIARNLHSGAFNVELLAFVVAPYSQQQRDRLAAAMQKATAREYCRLAVDLGGWFADAATRVIAESGVARADIRAIGTHGQTLWHEPGHSTWQLDSPAVIAERTKIPVVSNMRARDMAVGGQGAPLVPIADALLFGGGRWRALQNIGGIANVTVVPPNGDLASVRAFDTGPGVAILDAVVRAIDPTRRYDDDGRIGALGRVLVPVVERLLAEPYFAAEPPKSTGRELFDTQFVERFSALCRASTHVGDVNDADVVATATALTAASIADAYRRFIPEPIEEMLVSGGGAKNPTLLAMLEKAVAPLPVVPFDARYFDGEAKEAVAFALLAHLHLEGIPGNVTTATGARFRRVLGSLTPA